MNCPSIPKDLHLGLRSTMSLRLFFFHLQHWQPLDWEGYQMSSDCIREFTATSLSADWHTHTHGISLWWYVHGMSDHKSKHFFSLSSWEILPFTWPPIILLHGILYVWRRINTEMHSKLYVYEYTSKAKKVTCTYLGSSTRATHHSVFQRTSIALAFPIAMETVSKPSEAPSRAVQLQDHVWDVCRARAGGCDAGSYMFLSISA